MSCESQCFRVVKKSFFRFKMKMLLQRRTSKRPSLLVFLYTARGCCSLDGGYVCTNFLHKYFNYRRETLSNVRKSCSSHDKNPEFTSHWTNLNFALCEQETDRDTMSLRGPSRHINSPPQFYNKRRNRFKHRMSPPLRDYL